jgi:hypothetical protein
MRMQALSRILLAIILPGVFAFCVFGFLATFEPLPPPTQWTWRAIYAGIGLAALVGAGALAIRRR